MTLLQLVSDVTSIATSYDELQKTTVKILLRFLINISTVFILIRGIYYSIYKQRELFFTYFTFNIIIFFIAFLLNKVDLSMGAAFGLFAVFSMLRYKTEEIGIKDMTYLFLVIAIGLISAITTIKGSSIFVEYLFLIGINAIVLLFTYVLESSFLMKAENSKIILYEKIDLIKAGKEEELKADLSSRTGCSVHRYSIQKIDFLRDTVQIKIYFYEK